MDDADLIPDPDFAPIRTAISLADLAREPASHLGRLRESGRPAMLTVDGGEELVILSASAHKRLIRRLNHAEATVGIYRGLDEVRRGETVPLDEAFRQIREDAARRLEQSRALREQDETILAIQEGLDSIARGEGRPAREALEEIRARVKGERANQ
jgi:predicted transcriptional regulator